MAVYFLKAIPIQTQTPKFDQLLHSVQEGTLGLLQQPGAHGFLHLIAGHVMVSHRVFLQLVKKEEVTSCLISAIRRVW